MLWLLLIPAAPLLIWLSLGVTFTIVNYIQWLVQQEGKMPDRLIRYTNIVDDTRPHLLSTFNEEKNLVCIDRTLAEILPVDIRNRLEMTEIEYTKVVDDGFGLRFGAY